MRMRIATLLAAAVLLLPAAPALAQVGQNPFDNLPPQPTPAPTVEEVDDGNDDVGRNTLYIIGGVLVVVFVGIGVWISRDARRKLPADRRETVATRDQGPHRHQRQAKSKARAKGRAQRRARKTSRRAR